MAYKHREELQKGLIFLEHSIMNLADFAHCLSASEFASSIFALSLSMKRMRVLCCDYQVWLSEHIFDGGVLDVNEFAQKLSTVKMCFVRAIDKSVDSPRIIANEEDCETEMIKENSHYHYGRIQNKLAISEDGDFAEDAVDTTKCRAFCIQQLTCAKQAIYENLDTIIDVLCRIDEDRLDLFRDEMKLNAYLEQLEKEYLDGDWEADKEYFIQSIRQQLGYEEDQAPNKSINSYHYMLRAFDDSTSVLTRKKVEGKRQFLQHIIDHREEINEEQLMNCFQEINCRRLLVERVASFEWEGSVEEPYDKVFENVVSMEITKSIVPTIQRRTIQKIYQYAVVKLALDDFGLTLSHKNRNAGEWLTFVNEHMRRPQGESSITDNTNITKVTGKLLERCFKSLSQNDLAQTNLTQDSFSTYEPTYRECISIINNVLHVDLKESGFADYWLGGDAGNTDNVGWSSTERMQMMVSVFKGDCLRF